MLKNLNVRDVSFGVSVRYGTRQMRELDGLNAQENSAETIWSVLREREDAEDRDDWRVRIKGANPSLHRKWPLNLVCVC